MDKKPSKWHETAGALLPLVLAVATAVVSFSAALSLGGGLFAAVFAALFSVIATIVVTTVVSRTTTNNLQELLEENTAQTADERIAGDEARLRRVKEEHQRAQSSQNRDDFHKKALIVVTYIAIYMAAMWHFFSVLPSMVFGMPVWVLAITWVLLLLILPRSMVVVLLLALTGVSAIVSVMGPTVILQFLPYILTMPMMMVMNLFIMFGPLMFFNIQQIKVVVPGSAKWGRSIGQVKGQRTAVKQVLINLQAFMDSKKERLLLVPKGTMLIGPPGTGKTMLAEGVATELGAPIILTTGSAFTSTFVGVGIIVMIYLFWRAEALARTYGKCVIFIDEIDQIGARRAGVLGGNQGVGVPNIASAFDYNEFGQVGDINFETPASRQNTWDIKYPTPPPNRVNMMFGGMGMGGGSIALPVLLAKMDGIDAPPFLQQFWRSKVNMLLDAFLVPVIVKFGKKVITLRVSPAQAVKLDLLFLGATNVPDQLDPALTRPGRFETTVYLGIPGAPERVEIIQLYVDEADQRGLLHPELKDNPGKIEALAKMTSGFSPADLMHVVRAAPNIHRENIRRLKALRRKLDAGLELDKDDRRFWEAHRTEMEEAGWDQPKVTWSALLESHTVKRYGLAKPANTTPAHRETTAVHETGHLIALYYFLQKWFKATMFSVLPRAGYVGLVSFERLEENDPYPEDGWMGMIRVSLASVAIERLILGQRGSGTSSDLKSATRIARMMTGHLAMMAYRCTPEERPKFIEIGQTLLYADEAPGGMTDPRKTEAVCLILGQAFYDVARLVEANRNLIPQITAAFSDRDEVFGTELDELWERLGRDLRPLTPAMLDFWPQVENDNPNYVTVEVGT